MLRRISAISLALILTTLPMLLPINTVSAQVAPIPNPHQYKFLTVGMPLSLDPGWAYDSSSGELLMQVYEPLVAYDHEKLERLVPLLAENLPKFEKAIETLTNTTVVNMANPVNSNWFSSGVIFNLFGWRDEDTSGTLNVNDLVWLENTADHEKSFHGAVRSVSGNVILEVSCVRYVFKIRQNVHFHAWTSDIPGYADHTANLLTTEDVEFSFERNYVLDHADGPIGLIMTPTLGIVTTRQYNLSNPDEASLVGHMIDNAFAHNLTHFWVNLAGAYGPFLQIITQSWAYVMSKAWVIALQEMYIPDSANRWYGWGSPPEYANWLGYTNPPYPDEIDAGPRHMCGTGPYYFDYLIEDDRWQIKKYDNTTNGYGYWRGWPAEGRRPDLYLDTVISLYTQDPFIDIPLFLSNNSDVQCDSVYVPRGMPTDLIQPGIRTWTVMPTRIVSCFMMGYDPEETSPYLPQMPPGTPKHDFFSDIHIRRAFAHLVNHTLYIQTAFYNEATWPNSVIIDGLKYHNPYQPAHEFDLEKTLEEFKLAFDGSTTPGLEGPAYKQGFHVKLLYNQGNQNRRKLCEMMEYELEVEMADMWPEGVNDNCVTLYEISPISPIPSSQLPQWMSRWIADFPDAENFARPFIHTLGIVAKYQRIQYGQSGMKQQTWDLTPFGLGTFGDPALVIDNEYVNTLIEKAVWIDDSTSEGYSMRQAMYYHIQDIYYQECPSFAIYQPIGRRWERNWVQDWYYNPLNPYYEGPGGYYYHMWKHSKLKAGDFGNLTGGYYFFDDRCDWEDLFLFRKAYVEKYHQLCDFDKNEEINYLDLSKFRSCYLAS